MQTFPFRTIILPALLASSAVFAALTLPLASHQTSRNYYPRSAPAHHWFSRVDNGERQGLSIRYIGFAILSSTVTGIGTAEILRSRHAHYCRHQSLLKQALGASQSDQPEAPLEALSAGLSPDLTVEKPSDRVTNPRLAELGAEPEQDWLTVNPATDTHPLDWDALQAGTSPVKEDWPSPPVLSEAIGSGPHRTYQVKTPAGQRLTALCINGEFYSFYRLSQTIETVQLTAQKLGLSHQNAVVTVDEGGYILWRHQPGAERVSSRDQPPVLLSNG